MVRQLWCSLAAAWAVALWLPSVGFAQESEASAPANFYTPMTDGERWHQYLFDNFLSPGACFRALGTSMGDSRAHRPPEWGRNRYVQNFASQFGRFAIQGTVESSLAKLLGDDTRHHRCACTGFWKRTGYALSRGVLTYDHMGHRTLNAPGLSGAYAGSMLMMYWYPRGYRPLTDGVRVGTIGVGMQTGVDVIREFSPELKTMFHHLF